MDRFADRPRRNSRNPVSELLFLCCLIVPVSGVAATGPDIHEADNHYYEARSLALNDVGQAHNFHGAADEDWLTFHAVKDRLYFLGTRDAVGARCNTVFELYNARGAIIDDELGSFEETRGTGYGETERVAWRCPAAGIYYLRIMQASPRVFGDETDYTVYLWDGSGPMGEMPVWGKVTSAANTRPIQGARVRLVDLSTGLTQGLATTDPRGIFQLSAMDGKYRLEARATGYVSREKSITVSGEPVNTSFALVLKAASRPNLAVTSVSAPTSSKPGDRIQVRWKVKNVGAAAATGFSICLYLSEVPGVDFGRGRLVKVIEGLALEAGGVIEHVNSIPIPPDCGAGEYWMVAGADMEGRVAESNEANNQKASPNTITVE